ncbi:MAG: phosphatidylglycerol lysyltransferase domain-containing protein [Candidatus Paceibacterota bacterium]
MDILYCWKRNKEVTNKSCDITHEEIALKRLFQTAHNHNVILSCLYVDNKMIGFSIDEILDEGYAISHFIKGDINYRGVYEYMNVEVAQQLLISGAKFWNWEQDLNLEGLRQLKISYNPINHLKSIVLPDPQPVVRNMKSCLNIIIYLE